jgi:hypothetical protein
VRYDRQVLAQRRNLSASNHVLNAEAGGVPTLLKGEIAWLVF